MMTRQCQIYKSVSIVKQADSYRFRYVESSVTECRLGAGITSMLVSPIYPWTGMGRTNSQSYKTTNIDPNLINKFCIFFERGQLNEKKSLWHKLTLLLTLGLGASCDKVNLNKVCGIKQQACLSPVRTHLGN